MGESPVLHLDASQPMSVSPLDPLMITSFALSMAVNALVTTLIVFKILKVFLEVKPALGSVATEGTKLRSVIFIIIESGMALFAIQLVRVVISCLELNESSKFGNWKVRQKCSANTFGGNFRVRRERDYRSNSLQYLTSYCTSNGEAHS